MKITEKLKATLRKMLSLQLGEVAIKDGKKLYWSSEEDLREGLEVFVEGENGELIPAPNGVYETEDDKKIEVEDGVVKKIEDPKAEVAPENVEENLEDAQPEEEPAEDKKEDEKEDAAIEDRVAAVEAKVAEILAAFEQVLNGMSALEGRIEEVEAKVAKIETEPDAAPAEEKVEETKMSRMDILKNLK
mgnify:CR=1 FL=1